MNGWLIALALLAAHMLLLYALMRSGKMEKWNLSVMLGFVLMIRTQKGRILLDKIARPKRFWNAMGDLGTGVTLLGMFLMTLVFLWSVYEVLRPGSPVQALSASEVLVIPGVNPFVPLWYGIAALILTLVVHEGGHGVLARANGMRLKSLGLLYAVVPIGAFVEPDDLDLKVAPRRQRLRVFAAGPAVNMTFAVVFLAVFAGMMGSLAAAPGAHVQAVVADGPAQTGGITELSTIVSADGQPVGTYQDLSAFLADKRPGDTVEFDLKGGQRATVTLSSRWDGLSESEKARITAENATLAESLQKRPHMGVLLFQPEAYAYMSEPFTNPRGLLHMLSLPIGEVRGAPVLSTLLPAFMDTPFDATTFWILANLAFWFFWLNLMVGLTNMLPMLPLDGGHVFRDVVGGVVQRVRPSMASDRREKLVGRAAGAMSLLMLSAFLLQIIGPHLFR